MVMGADPSKAWLGQVGVRQLHALERIHEEEGYHDVHPQARSGGTLQKYSWASF